MGTHTDANGETAALKKRKRTPKDEASPLNKRLRSKSKTTTPRKSDLAVDLIQVDSTPSRSEKTAALVLKDGSDSVTAVATATKPPRSAWKVSKPMGGRLLDIDPIFSTDERHLILTYNTSVQVYSTADSLLVRRIELPVTNSDNGGYITAAALSRSSADHIWVASTDGRIWNIDWKTGAGADIPLAIDAKILDMTLDSVELKEGKTDILLVLQQLDGSRAQLVAYNHNALISKSGKLLHTLEGTTGLVRSTAGGRFVAAATGATLHMGMLRKSSGDALATLAYRFYSFDAPDLIACLDLQGSTRITKKGREELQQVDLVLGGARGAIYLYSDIASKVGDGSHSKAGVIQPRKQHWHRNAVHTVKWSLDGNYLISGGYETVLVLWQLDTGKLSFLPHLSAAIENIVVSPQGSSYAIHLDDNTVMVISTEEMKPTAYISGIQAVVLGEQRSKEAMVRRVWEPSNDISAPLITAVNPTNPSHMFLCVGNGLQATAGGGHPSTPQVQVFDTSSFRGVAKHAIARTNPTDSNTTSHGAPIIEPTVTKLAFSHDGKWLASVDEWQPPKKDAEIFLTGTKTATQVRREKREIYLKFWEVGADGDALEFVTRVNEAHHTNRAEKIFDLASDPSSTRFATIGNDGMVRFWSSKVRRRDGLVATGQDGHQLKVWTCSRAVSVPSPGQQEITAEPVLHPHRSGAVTFSEDGSILFAALGERSEAVVAAIDTETGEIRETIFGMFKGDVRGIKSLGSRLIMLSDDLVVYDIVSDEVLYSFSLKEASSTAKPLTQLAVNHESRSFAIAAPIPSATKKGVKSELVVFSVDDSEPLFAQTFPHLITSLTPALSSPGFVAIDSAAQVWSVTEGAEQANMIRPLADLGVEDVEVETKPTAMDSAMQDGEASDDEMQDADVDMGMDVDDYDIHQAVVAPQHLADIFNVAPAFAMPPIEDIFDRVATLFAAKPART